MYACSTSLNSHKWKQILFQRSSFHAQQNSRSRNIVLALDSVLVMRRKATHVGALYLNVLLAHDDEGALESNHMPAASACHLVSLNDKTTHSRENPKAQSCCACVLLSEIACGTHIAAPDDCISCTSRTHATAAEEPCGSEVPELKQEGLGQIALSQPFVI
eukprot:m.530952 g.530952  ORF g.530952 m.530952 type:complete len:161 (+) comp57572_c0_seq12:1590-2072(+)